MTATPSAVPRAYASSYCDKYMMELDGEVRYRLMHAHRCTGEHGTKNDVIIHSCVCGAEFYFVEDMLESIIRKMEGRTDVIGSDSTNPEYIERITHTESVTEPPRNTA